MYLHLGLDKVVRLDEGVGIFDMEKSTISKFSRQFLADAEKGGRIVNVAQDLRKAILSVLTRIRMKPYIFPKSPRQHFAAGRGILMVCRKALPALKIDFRMI